MSGTAAKVISLKNIGEGEDRVETESPIFQLQEQIFHFQDYKMTMASVIFLHTESMRDH